VKIVACKVSTWPAGGDGNDLTLTGCYPGLPHRPLTGGVCNVKQLERHYLI
jgi:hypothetical protein